MSGVEQQIGPVDVISLCSANGDIRPLRMRIEDGEHRLLRIDIDEVVSSREVQYVGIEAHIFLCRATVMGRKWLFELKYTVRSHSWSFMKRVY